MGDFSGDGFGDLGVKRIRGEHEGLWVVSLNDGTGNVLPGHHVTSGGGDAPTLPRNRAFVVQFASDKEGSEASCTGRVEHLVSGQATRFDSSETLRDFIEVMIRCVRGKVPQNFSIKD